MRGHMDSMSNLVQTLCILGPLFQPQGDLLWSHTNSPTSLSIHYSNQFWHYTEFASDYTSSRARFPTRLLFHRTPDTSGVPAYPHFCLTWLQIWDFLHPLWIENSQNDSQNSGKCCTYNDHLFVKDTNEHLDKKTYRSFWGWVRFHVLYSRIQVYPLPAH